MSSPSKKPPPSSSQRKEAAAPSITPILPSRKFSRADRSLVASFSCCVDPAKEEKWEKDVNDWITVSPTEYGAISAVETGDVEVWLYINDDGALIGYGSLGKERIIDDDGNESTICLIPFVGISTDFQGVPEHPKEARYSRRILAGLIEEAKKRKEFDDLFLYVDVSNPAFPWLYPKFGFEEFDRISDDGRTWILMHQPLFSKRHRKRKRNEKEGTS